MSTDPVSPPPARSPARSAPPEPDCAAVVDALILARLARDFDAPPVRAAVAECAVAYRAAGLGPERLLVTLKRRIRESALPEMGEWYRAALTDRVVVWAIEAYYGITDA
ncbi:MAG: hypothetical protein ACJ79S_13040 [Gemmatimonadaceae bacterium]